ncbi:phospholipase D-like domain-containing protein [Flavobacterium sp. FPG59]|uniref:phospholipase D-like domain-containing protein n=1 Tax=Flavobacterium sp. FPG59 TaxID=1929267 RepID=UPI000A3AF4AC|nr:phospholipase D-like domain-containing protein [Flavobacterium sp. FPG59]OUD34970.1 hypothetical protein FPG59_11825 [Flavobacterium sp. FPG59]
MNSYFSDIDYQIIKQIKLAQSRILVAVAWFTNTDIGKEIINKKGIDIEILVDDNKINRESENLIAIIREGIEVTFVKDLNEKYYQMHNKFCTIDNAIVVTGSYNWTYSSKSNDENITIINDQINAALYAHEFRRIKNLKFPDDGFSISQEERKEIVDLIYNGLKELLRANIDNFEKKLICEWSNEKVKNKIRIVNERSRNILQSMSGHLAVYNELISKYGLQFYTLASENEKIEARDKFLKKDLGKLDDDLRLGLQYFKVFAIMRLLQDYAKFLKDNNDWDKTQRVLKVVKFISDEKNEIGKEINISFL